MLKNLFNRLLKTCFQQRFFIKSEQEWCFNLQLQTSKFKFKSQQINLKPSENKMEFSNAQSSSICPIFSPCANYFATFSNNNVYIKDAGCSDLKNYAQIPFKQKNVNIKAQPQLKFSSDSKLIALKIDKKLEIYDIQGNIKMRIKEENFDLEDFVWVQDVFPYQIIAFYAGLPHCVIYNLETKQQSYIKNYKFKSSNGYSFSKGSHPGTFLAMLQKHSGKDCIAIYYTRTFEMLNFITLDTFDAAKIQFTSGGDLIVIENKINFKVYVVDPFRGVIGSYGEKDYCLGVSTHKLSNNQNFLALGVHDDCVHVLNTVTWKPICEFEISERVDASKTIYYKQENEEFSIIREGKYKLGQKRQAKQAQEGIGGISMIEFSPGDEYLAVKHQLMSNSIFIYEMRTLQLVTVIQTVKTIRDMKWLLSCDNEYKSLCIATGSKKVYIWRTSCHTTHSNHNGGDGRMNNIQQQSEICEIGMPVNSGVSVSNIELGREGKMMMYSMGQKKYMYAIYEGGEE